MRDLFEYAVIRAVPRIERGEQINVGVVLYCQARDYLRARVELNEDRLRALAPNIDVAEIRNLLAAWEGTCNGTGSQPASKLKLGDRFRWLTAPRSTIIQAGPVHTGLTDDPDADLERLLDTLVR